MNVSKQAVAAVEQYLADHRDDLISDLQALVAIPSKKEESAPGLPFGKPCADALDLALRQAARLGFDTHNLDNYVGWAEMGEGEEMLGILAHLDVVPEGDGWSVPPYSGVVKDGLIWGRGTQDDKGPALIALYAMAAVKAAGSPPISASASSWAAMRRVAAPAWSTISSTPSSRPLPSPPMRNTRWSTGKRACSACASRRTTRSRRRANASSPSRAATGATSCLRPARPCSTASALRRPGRLRRSSQGAVRIHLLFGGGRGADPLPGGQRGARCHA